MSYANTAGLEGGPIQGVQLMLIAILLSQCHEWLCNAQDIISLHNSFKSLNDSKLVELKVTIKNTGTDRNCTNPL